MLPGKKLQLLDFVEMARRRVWLIAIPPFVGLLLGLVASSRVPNVYQSDMLIAIDPQRVPDAYVRSTVVLRADLRMDALSVQVMSRTNLERMITSLNLYPELRGKLPMEDVVALMSRNIEVQLERPRNGPQGPEAPHAFRVRFTHPDPKVAAEVTQELGSLFVQQNIRDRGSIAAATSEFLDRQLEEARLKLVEQERRLEAFRAQYGKELPTQMTANMNAMSQTQLQVQSLVESIARDRDRKQMLERLYREASAEPPPPDPATAASLQGGTIGQINPNATARQQLAAARQSLAALEMRYTPDHPDVVRAKRLIADLEPRAAEEARADAQQASSASVPTRSGTETARRENLRQMRAEIESLDRQTAFKESEERRLRGEIAEYQRRVEAVPHLESAWVALSRDYDTQQTAYKELLTKSGAAKLAVDLEAKQIGENFRVVDSAGVPVHPLPSMRGAINAGGLALGLLFGLGIAAFLELRDASFRTEADVLEVLALPVLAMVPRVHTAAELASAQRRRMAFSAVGVLGLAVAGYVTWTLKLWNSLI